MLLTSTLVLGLKLVISVSFLWRRSEYQSDGASLCFADMDSVQHLWTECKFLSYDRSMTNEELLTWRHSQGMTRQALADALGISVWTIVKWERGERRMPGRWLDLALERLACDATRPTPEAD